MELILKQAISSLGLEGDVVTLNLVTVVIIFCPREKPFRLHRKTLPFWNKTKQILKHDEPKIKNIAEETAKNISGLTVVIEQLAGIDERLFGSVTTADICTKLAELNVI